MYVAIFPIAIIQLYIGLRTTDGLGGCLFHCYAKGNTEALVFHHHKLWIGKFELLVTAGGLMPAENTVMLF